VYTVALGHLRSKCQSTNKSSFRQSKISKYQTARSTKKCNGSSTIMIHRILHHVPVFCAITALVTQISRHSYHGYDCPQLNPMILGAILLTLLTLIITALRLCIILQKLIISRYYSQRLMVSKQLLCAETK
jgi:hypothetical protein